MINIHKEFVVSHFFYSIKAIRCEEHISELQGAKIELGRGVTQDIRNPLFSLPLGPSLGQSPKSLKWL